MRKKCNDFDAVGAERMTDTELSKSWEAIREWRASESCWALFW